MRSLIVFILLVVMLTGFGVLLGLRHRQDHQMPEVSVAAEDDASDAGESHTQTTEQDASPDGSNKRLIDASPAKSSSHQAQAKSATDASPAIPQKAPAQLLERPLRVIGLGWEIIAPGLVANRGMTPGKQNHYKKAGLAVHIRSSNKVVDLERALARGGADERGADVAILPLPVFIASYEQLRALSPHIFFVFGWSHGHEALMSWSEDPLLNLPRNREIQLVAERGSPSQFFAYFVLDLAGIAPNNVMVFNPGSDPAKNIDLVALRQAARGQPANADSRRFVLTTADATRLIPYVAIAPEGLINNEADALQALCSVWLTGVEELRRDVPAAARRIAAIRGAPEALELLGLMGRVDSSTLRENAQVAGLAGRHALTIDLLFQHTWRLWREADVVTSPPPDRTPMNTSIIASLVRAGSSMADGAAGTLGQAQAPRITTQRTGQRVPLLVHRIENRRFTDDDLIARLGFLADVFGPLQLRITLRNDSNQRTRTIAANARDRFGLPGNRLTTGRRGTGRAAPAAIELLPTL